MKFSIFIFLAAAASLGSAHKPESPNKSGSYESPSVSQPVASGLPTGLPSGLPTGLPSGLPTGIPTGLPTDPSTPTEPATTDLPSQTTGQPPSQTGAPDFQSIINKTANDPISELLSLSTECQGALFSIVANPEFFQCVPIGALLPLLPIVADPNGLKELLKDPVHSLPPVLTPVFDGLCAAPKCSDKGVAGSLKAVKEGCKKDAKSPLIGMLTGVLTFYSPVRDSICFESNKKEYCVIDTLKKVFSIPKPPITITGTIIDNIAFAEPKFVCTPCNKAILNTIFNYIGADTNQSAEYLASLGVSQGLLNIGKLGVAVKCGFQFLDGEVGHPEKTDPNDFEYQLSNSSVPSGASNLKGISFMTMIGGALLASTLMI